MSSSDSDFDIGRYHESLFSKVSKDALADYLGVPKKLKKSEMIEKLKAQFKADPASVKKYYDEFRDDIAIGPYYVEHLLPCSKTERIRWTEEKKLPVATYDSFKYGEFPLYDRWAIEHDFPDSVLQAWRNEHKAEVTAKRKAASKKVSVTKNENQKKRKIFLSEFSAQLKEWSNLNPELCAMLRLAYWTVFVSRWAKKNQLRARAARKEERITQYEKAASSWYSAKNKAIAVLAVSPFSKLSFYRPENPDKVNVWFCEEHMEELREESRWFGYTRPIDAYYMEPEKYDSCPKCEIDVQKDYYSLYYLEIEADGYRYSFHTPYPIGKKFLPSDKTLPKVGHEENEDSVFRFGRPVDEEEMVTHSEKLVSKKFEEALADARTFVDSGK